MKALMIFYKNIFYIVANSYNGLCLRHMLQVVFIILWRLFLITSANVLSYFQ